MNIIGSLAASTLALIVAGCGGGAESDDLGGWAEPTESGNSGNSTESEDDIATVSEALTFSTSNDALGAAPGIVSIVDTFALSVVSARATDVSWSEDDAKVTICLRDDSTGSNVKCISARNKHTSAGETIPFATNRFSFSKGRNSSARPGDVGAGQSFSIWMRLETLDGINRSTSRSLRYTWDQASRTYYVNDYYDRPCGSVDLIVSPESAMTEQRTDDLMIGCQSAVDVTWKLSWQSTSIYGTIAARSGSGNDGTEWHHFLPLNPTWYGYSETVGARLTSTSGNPDLYVRAGSWPTLTAYECAPLNGYTTTEQCTTPGTFRYYSVRNRNVVQAAAYQLQLVRGGITPIN